MSAEGACHELLVRLAGRLPDELLWRMRDWLASGGTAALSAMLPRELLRNRIGLTDDERDLLGAIGEWGASRRLLDAVLPMSRVEEPVPDFHPGPEGTDQAALSLLAVVRGHPGCVELRQAWRRPRDAGRDDQRIALVHGAERPWVLTGTLQRLLRAHGDRTPCVEVLPPHGEPPAYHKAAIIGSTPLWRSPDMALTGS